MLLKGFHCCPLSIKKERSALFHALKQVVLVDVFLFVAGYEVSVVDEIR